MHALDFCCASVARPRPGTRVSNCRTGAPIGHVRRTSGNAVSTEAAGPGDRSDADRHGVQLIDEPHDGSRLRSRPVRRRTLRGRAVGQCRAPASAAADLMGVDDGTKLTLWTRAATRSARGRRSSRRTTRRTRTRSTLTFVPTDDYQTKVGAAAGAKRPAGPVLRRRRVHAQLDLAGPVPGHHDQDRRPARTRTRSRRRASTRRPGTASSTACRSSSTCRSGCTTRTCSRQAGLDPEKPPTTLQEFADRGARGRQARRRHPRHVLRRQLRRLRGVHLVADRLGRRRAGHEPRRHRSRCSTATRTRQIYSTFKSLSTTARC